MVRTCYSDLYVSYTLKRTVRVHNTVYLREAHIILGYTLNHMVRVHNTVFLRKPYIILSYTLKLYRSFTVKYSKELLFRIGDAYVRSTVHSFQRHLLVKYFVRTNLRLYVFFS